MQILRSLGNQNYIQISQKYQFRLQHFVLDSEHILVIHNLFNKKKNNLIVNTEVRGRLRYDQV